MKNHENPPEFPAAYAMAAFTCPILAVVAPLGLAPMGLGLGILALVAARRSGMKAGNWLGWLAVPALVCLWGAISAIWAADPTRALSTSVRLLAISVTGLATAAVLPRLTPRSTRAVALGLASSIVLATVLLTVEYLSGNRLSALVMEIRGHKPFPDGAKSQLSRGATVVAVMLWPAALLLARFYGRRAGMALIAVAACSLLLGDSLAARMALITSGAVAATAFLHPALIRSVLRWGLVAATLAMPLGAQFLPSPPHSWEIFPDLPLSAHQRLGIWNFAGNRATEHPLLGWGLDASRAIPGGDEELFINRMASANNIMWTLTGQRLPLHPHNAFLQWGLELGLVGSALMAAFLWQLGGRTACIPAPGARAAAAGALAAAATISAVSYGFWQSWWLVTLWLTAALCALAARVKAEDLP
ncbi:MAG: O-antigen ligase family protein [Magnetospirillum sp.]|nr:MAG: O-antigen ligase family protein [Magnetospirillum sp.]